MPPFFFEFVLPIMLMPAAALLRLRCHAAIFADADTPARDDAVSIDTPPL